ncbi:putative Ig domain-containing protein [Paraburkholderia sp. A3RO-2L]|uniref:putative Ig domain-containing protein n=1 Tax=Paraburkholderia sp. A3RO-2L TaxID=3028376 RepID=UPI003DA86797
MKKTAIAALVAVLASSTFATEYYVVVPVPNKSPSAGNVMVTLSGYSIPAGVVGRAYTGFDFNSVLQVLGDPNYNSGEVRWSVAGGSLPAGLSLSSSGKLSGTPTAAGTSGFQVMAAYKTKAGEQLYQVIVAAVSVALAAATLPAGVQGTAYAYDLKQNLSVTGDPAYTPAQVSWSLVSGPLPAGMQLNSDGTLTGIPTVGGSFPFTVKATYLGQAGQRQYQLVLATVSVSLSNYAFPTLLAGTPFSYDLKQNLTVSGDPAYAGSGTAVTWSVSTGTLPTGLAQANGVISGTPTKVGASNFGVSAAYKASSGSTNYSMQVNANVLATGNTRTWSDGTYAASCNAYLNPTAPYVYSGATGTGVYRNNPAGSPMDVYCDMTTNGGGWTLLMKQANGDGTTLQGDTTYWTNGTTLNDTVASMNKNDGNFVSAAFSKLPTTQLMLQAANESAVQTHGNASAMTAMAAFSNANMTTAADPIGSWLPSAPNWGVHATKYPDGEALTAARFGFNFGEIWTSNSPGVIRMAPRWGWVGNQDSDTSGVQSGSYDACGGLGCWGAAYGQTWMSNNKNTWATTTYYLWGK